MFPKFYEYKLDNGLKVLLIPIKDTKNIATSLTFNIGYLEETKKQDGIAHLTEHIISRYITNHTKIKDIKSNGEYVYTNANTNHFKTQYHIYSSTKFMNDIIDSFAKLYDFDRTDRNLFYKEMGAVIVELKQIISDKNKYIMYKNIPEMIFGKNNILVNDPISEIKNLKTITECQLIDFVKQYYNPVNSILTIVGDFNKSKTLTYIKTQFNKLDKGIVRPDRIINIPLSKNPKFTFQKTDSNLIKFHLSFVCPNINNDKSNAIILLLKKILVELNDSSILFKRLRTKLGIIYSPNIIRLINQYYGLFIINYNIEPNNYNTGLKELIEILNELKNEKIDDTLLKMAKNKVYYEIILTQNNLTPKEYLHYSSYLLHKKRELLNPLEFYNKYTKHITANDIKNWCKQILTKNNSYLSLIGVDNLKDFSIKQLKKLGNN